MLIHTSFDESVRYFSGLSPRKRGGKGHKDLFRRHFPVSGTRKPEPSRILPAVHLAAMNMRMPSADAADLLMSYIIVFLNIRACVRIFFARVFMPEEKERKTAPGDGFSADRPF